MADTRARAVVDEANRLWWHFRSTVAKRAIVVDLLSDYGVRWIQPSHLSFHFGQRAVATLKPGAIFTSPSSGSASPSLAYLDLDDLPVLRNQSIPFPPGNRSNYPIGRLRRKRLRQLQPAVQAEDPYIAAILIALAQGLRQEKRLQGMRATAETATGADANAALLRSPASTGEGRLEDAGSRFKVRLLATTYKEPRCLYLFTARFPAKFLDKLDTPSRFSPCDPLVISYSRIDLVQSTSRLAKLLETLAQEPSKKPAPK